MSENIEVSLEPDILFTIGNVEISNAVFSSLTITLFLCLFFYFYSKRLTLVPGRTQVLIETSVEYYYRQLIDSYHDTNKAIRHLSIILSLFFFILIANQFTLIPLVQSIVYDGVHVFTSPTAHLSQTLALSLIVVVICQYLAFKVSPIGHINEYIKINEFKKVRSKSDLFNAIIGQFIGLLNIIGEFAKVISLSCRLFGNIFAGEIMIAVIASLAVFTAFIIPIPFYIIGIFSGFIQALVFAFLSLSFITASAGS